jgi:hypothetical protein
MGLVGIWGDWFAPSWRLKGGLDWELMDTSVSNVVSVTVYGVRTSHVPSGERVLLLIVIRTFYTLSTIIDTSCK